MGKVQKSQKAEEKMKRRPVTKPVRRRVAQAPLRPRYREELKIPSWVQEIDDNCLRTMLFEAYTMKFYALDQGHDPNGRTMGSVDKIFERLRYAHWNQTPADNWRSALSAIRKSAGFVGVGVNLPRGLDGAYMAWSYMRHEQDR